MPRDLRAPTPAAHPCAGFSLVEVLIAALVLLIVLLGVIPLFARSMVNNVMGQDYTAASNFARSELEYYYRLPFNSAELEIPDGQRELVTADCWVPTPSDELGEGQWVAIADETTECEAAATWRRVTVIRQHSAAELEFEPERALPGGTDPSQIHLKEIEIFLEATKRGGLMGPPQRFDLRVFKSA